MNLNAPGLKMTIMQQVVASLFDKNEEYLRSQTNELIDKNVKVSGQDIYRISVQGRVLQHTVLGETYKSSRPHESLEEEFNYLVKSLYELDLRRTGVTQYLIKGLRIAKTKKDLYALFPESVSDAFAPTLAGINGTDEDEQTVSQAQIENFRASTETELEKFNIQKMNLLLVGK